MYQKKCCEGKHVDLLLIGEQGRRHDVLIKSFNTLFMIILCIVEKNIFAIIAYKLLAQKKN